MMGDGECSEGSVWEAMAFASYYKLDNLVAIMDVNRLGQSEAAPLKHDMEAYRKRCEAFGSVCVSLKWHWKMLPQESFVLSASFGFILKFNHAQSEPYSLLVITQLKRYCGFWSYHVAVYKLCWLDLSSVFPFLVNTLYV